MIYVRENLNYNRLALKFVHSAHGEVGVGCYLIPMPRNMKSPTSTDTTAASHTICIMTSICPCTYTRSRTPLVVYMKQPQRTNEGTDRRSFAEGQDKNNVGGLKNLLVCVKKYWCSLAPEYSKNKLETGLFVP